MGTDLDLLLLKQGERTKKAQELYEPWMDNKASSRSVAADYTPSPVYKPKIKHRSDYKFDEDYLKSLSPSENSDVTSGRSTAIDLPFDTPTNPTPLPTVEKPEMMKRKSAASKNAKSRQQTRSKSLSRASRALSRLSKNENFTMFYKWIFDGTNTGNNAEIARRLLFSAAK